MSQPFFTIVIPNYKTEPFLEQCLLSVVRQTCGDFECLVYNDGSPGTAVPDNAKQTHSSSDYWLRSDFKNQHIPPQSVALIDQAEYIFQQVVGKDDRFRFVSHANRGQGPTRNRGISEACGQRIVFLDCDDFLLPGYLSNAYQHISSLNTASGTVVYAGICNYQNGTYISFEDHQKHVSRNNNLATIFTFPTWTLGPVNYFWQVDILQKYKVEYPGGRGEDSKIFLNSLSAYQKEFGKQVAWNFQRISGDGYIYRLFPFQNFRVPQFEQELFTEMSSFVTQNLSDYDVFGLRIQLLARLYIVRFHLYHKKLTGSNAIMRAGYTWLARFLTGFSIILSGFQKI